MAATTGFTNIGVTLKLGDGATSETFNAVANVASYSLNQEADLIDATHLGSTSGFREFKQGFKSGTLDFEAHFDPDDSTQSDSSGLLAEYANGTASNWKLDFSAADNGGSGAPSTDPIASFAAILTQATINGDPDGMSLFQGQLTITGAVTWGSS